MKLSQREEIHLVLKSIGAQAGNANLDRVPIPRGFRGFIKRIRARVRTAGVTGTQSVDLNKNGTTVLGSQKIDFTGAVSPNATPSLGQVAVDGDSADFLSIDNDSVHSGTPANDLTVEVVIAQIPPAAVIFD